MSSLIDLAPAATSTCRRYSVSVCSAVASLVLLSGLACSAGSETASESLSSSSSGGASSGGTGGQPSVGSGGAGGDRSSAGGAGGAAMVCPTETLSDVLPVVHQGDTTGAPNIVRSSRLSLDDIAGSETPDHALLFVAPETGDYVVDLPAAPGPGCLASISEASGVFYDASWCPAAGQVKEIDGMVAAAPGITPSTISLTQGRELLVWVSCATWEQAQSGPYTLEIRRAP